jgi:phosphoglycolate phosphatase
MSMQSACPLADAAPLKYLQSMNFERPLPTLDSLKLAIFDFDGTLSLLREGWATIMARQGVELLEDESRFTELELAMLMLSGKPSILQMRKLIELAQAAGKPHPTDTELLKQFQERLAHILDTRLAAVASSPRGAFCVPGTFEYLDRLRSRGLHLALVSGTLKDYVVAEAEQLQLSAYFGDDLFAPEANDSAFTKLVVIRQLMQKYDVTGPQLIGYGDGYAETVAVRELGGYAVGLATRDIGEEGLHPMKAEMLHKLGADVLVPNYLPLLGEVA